jgi:sigma-B regulation protein RsbU (phosphoserine phosphatase)
MTKDAIHLDAYAKNEVSANRLMTFVLLIAAFFLVLVLIGYVAKLFDVSEDTQRLTVIVIPISIVLLCVPLAFIRTDYLSRPWFKYYVLFHFVMAIAILNVIMPKHAVLGWAVCIAITGHYYNPNVCRITFGTVVVMMIVSITLGVFVGEYDPDLLSGQTDDTNQVIHNYLLADTYPDSISGRYHYLNDLRDAGDDRYIKIFFEYLLGRVLFVTLIFIVIVSLNKRTKILMKNEVEASNENQKNKTELEVAKKIQLETLPDGAVSSENIEIVAELKAAKEVGGDLYDYLNIDKDHFAFLIGDVSGKGVPAAMFMMKTITAFRDFAKAGKPPSQILSEINESILKGNEASMFVTCFLAILDKRDGKLTYANAGHNPPIIGSDGNYRFLKCNPGFLLGCFKSTFIMDEEIVMEPGDVITLYTDGVTEARNNDGDFFGDERLLQAVNRKGCLCGKDIHQAVRDEVTGFVKDAPQSDDITVLTVRYIGAGKSFKEKDFDATKENVPDMLGFIEDFAEEHDLPEDLRKQLVIVGDELFSNIVKYGYDNAGGPLSIRLQMDDGEKEFMMTIADEAAAFNPLEVEEEPVGSDPKTQKIGGLGLMIVKTIMDECSYERVDGKNILTLKKSL